MVDHAYGLYFRNQTYYRVSNLDSRIENADHRLTDEISAFTSAVAHLYSHVSKPILDIVLVLWELRWVNFLFSALIIISNFYFFNRSDTNTNIDTRFHYSS